MQLRWQSVQPLLSGALNGMQDAKGPVVMAAVLGASCLGLPLGAALAWLGEVPARGLWSGLVLGGAVMAAPYAVRLQFTLNGARPPTTRDGCRRRPSAVMNAVVDALQPVLDTVDIDLPATARRI